MTLLRALAETRDPAYAPLFRAELAAAIDVGCLGEAAIGLAGLGDERGVARACDAVRSAPWGWLDLLGRLARAGAQDVAGRVLLEQTNRGSAAPWDLEEHLDHGSFLPADETLALARLVSRDESLWCEKLLAALRRSRKLSGPRERVIVDALCAELDAFEGRLDRREHAAATVLSLGLDAVTRFEAAGGPAIRPLLLGALRSGAPERADPFDDALGRAGPTAFAWAIEDADVADGELVSAARTRASLRVRGVDEAWDDRHGLSGHLSSRFSPESVTRIVDTWRAKPGSPALELTIERVADLRGVVLRARSLEDVPAGAVDDLDAFLREVMAALERAPGAAATVRLVVRR